MLTRIELPDRVRSILTAVVPAAGVFLVTSRAPSHLTGLLMTVLIGALILPLVARHPTSAVCVLIVFLPFQVPVLAWMFEHGAPVVVVRRLGALKDLALLGLLLRAFQDRSRAPRRPADAWLLAYLGVATAYLFLPYVLPILAPLPFSQRVLAWRVDVFFVALLLALRWINPKALNVSVIRWTVISVAGLVAAGAVYEFYYPSAWKDLLYGTLGVRQYSAVVLGNSLSFSDLLRYSDDGSIRAGSFLREPVFAAFFLLPGFFLALVQISTKRSVRAAALTVLIGVGLVCTTTRSALLVGVLGAAFAASRVLRSGSRYNRAFIPAMAALLVFAPVLLAQSSLTQRVTQAISGRDTSTQAHQTDITAGLVRALKHPLGTGLGTGAGTGQRFSVKGQVTTENAYLQVINELGVFALIAFIGLLFLITRELIALQGSATGLLLDRTAALAVAGAMIVGGVLQTVWLDFGVGVVAVVAIALPTVLHDQQRDSVAGQSPALTR